MSAAAVLVHVVRQPDRRPVVRGVRLRVLPPPCTISVPRIPCCTMRYHRRAAAAQRTLLHVNGDCSIQHRMQHHTPWHYRIKHQAQQHHTQYQNSSHTAPHTASHSQASHFTSAATSRAGTAQNSKAQDARLKSGLGGAEEEETQASRAKRSRDQESGVKSQESRVRHQESLVISH